MRPQLVTRRRIALDAIVAVLFGLAACSSPGPDHTTSATPGTSTRSTAVGHRRAAATIAPSVASGPAATPARQLTLTFTDPTRPTPARPPVGARSERTLTTTVREPPTGTGPWPLVVFGPGFDASAARYGALLDDLARAGFVVASPEFPGASSALAGTPDERDLAQEPCDLLFVAGALLAASIPGGPLAGAIRAGPVALAGHSDGATAAAFAALSLATGTCGGPRVGAVVAYSARPVPRRAGATAPVFAVTGSADATNPPSQTRALFTEAPTPSYLLTSVGDDHAAPPTTSPRRDAIAAAVIDFLRAQLLGDATARARIPAAGAQPGLALEQR